MSKPKKFPRTEPTKAKPSVVPAGTPTAASAPEVPLPVTPETSPVMNAVGESLAHQPCVEGATGGVEERPQPFEPVVSEQAKVLPPEEPKTVTVTVSLREDGPTLEEYVKAGYKAENYPPQGYKPRTATRTGGAGWFIPKQKPSGFGGAK